MPYCSACGNRVYDDDRFCAVCGAEIHWRTPGASEYPIHTPNPAHPARFPQATPLNPRGNVNTPPNHQDIKKTRLLGSEGRNNTQNEMPARTRLLGSEELAQSETIRKQQEAGEQKLLEEERKRKAAEKLRVEEERKRKAAEKLQQEEERKRLEADKLRVEEERRRKAAEKLRVEEERKRKAAEKLLKNEKLDVELYPTFHKKQKKKLHWIVLASLGSVVLLLWIFGAFKAPEKGADEGGDPEVATEQPAVLPEVTEVSAEEAAVEAALAVVADAVVDSEAEADTLEETTEEMPQATETETPVVRVTTPNSEPVSSPPRNIPCLSCGKSNPAGASRCGGCGGRLDLVKCPKCGNLNAPTGEFCGGCGETL